MRKLLKHEVFFKNKKRNVFSADPKYDNEQSNKHGRNYKKRFVMLPSVDHVGDGKGPADFKICAWRTNDAKNDLSYEELLEFCRKVISADKKALSTGLTKIPQHGKVMVTIG